MVVRLRALRSDGHQEVIEYPAEKLDHLSDDLDRLTQTVAEFGAIALDLNVSWEGSGSVARDLRVEDIWTTNTTKHKQPDGTQKKVTALVRDGPRAAEVHPLILKNNPPAPPQPWSPGVPSG